MNPEVEVQARVELLATADGGRQSPIFDDYRPHVVVDDGEMLGVRVRMGSEDSIAPGAGGLVALQLIYPAIDYSALQPGVVFSIRESLRPVGYGQVL